MPALLRLISRSGVQVPRLKSSGINAPGSYVPSRRLGIWVVPPAGDVAKISITDAAEPPSNPIGSSDGESASLRNASVYRLHWLVNVFFQWFLFQKQALNRMQL